MAERLVVSRNDAKPIGYVATRAAGTKEEDAAARDTQSGQRSVSQHGYDPGRGRLADKPSDIPATGWKDIVWRVYQNMVRGLLCICEWQNETAQRWGAEPRPSSEKPHRYRDMSGTIP